TFVHAFRNIVDHGIEPSEERQMAGKSEMGHIDVKVEQFSKNESHWIRITIEDDGAGISIEKMRQKVAATEPSVDVHKLSDTEVAQYVFSSGISTKEEVGEFSGRGIGMNAIKAEAEHLGGM